MPTFKGTGTLHLPGSTTAVQYSVEVAESNHSTGGRIRGWALHLKGELFAADLLGADLMLTLADGQQWDCVLVNKAGDLAARGQRGIYQP